MSIQEMGALIRSRRKSFRLTQLDLAEMSGVSQNTIRQVERGTGNPTVEVLGKLGKTLGFGIELVIPFTSKTNR